jgi:signal transduction histidine kinase
MEDMSDMVWSINPRNDSMQRVISRMREFATEIFEAAGIDYKFSEKIKDDLTLDSDKRKNLYLIFKEAINNAAKYSNASTVEIDLHQQGQTLILKVKDNGQGFEEQNIVGGNGLHNQRERAKEINGQVVVNSKIDQGTELVLQLPIA